MTKPKLLIFSDCYIYGGSERLMSFLVKNQVVNGVYDITFCYRQHRLYTVGMAEDFSEFKGKVVGLPLLSNHTFFYRLNSAIGNYFVKRLVKLPFSFLYYVGVYSLLNSLYFLHLLLKERPDVLHINNGGFPAARNCNLLVFIATIVGVRRIFYQVNNQARKAYVIDSLRNYLLNLCVKGFITSSKLAKKVLADNAGIPSSKIHIIQNIVSQKHLKSNRAGILAKLQICPETFLIVQVAFLTNRKGQIYLIQAIENLLKEQKEVNICLVLIGDGEDRKMLETYCLQQGLSKHVKFLGYESNYADYISASNLFALPSINNEDLPLVIIEALMLGKCILSTSLAGISEVIEDGYNGVLVSPKTENLAESLSRSIFSLYRDPDRVHQIEKNAAESAFQFSEHAYGNKLLNLYKTV